ncbi:MAG: alpha-amylase, partial [Methanosarcina sp.]|nr:alpha-amylase [Methanosarcina sp.]
MDRYFDRNQIFSRLLKTGREFLRLNNLFVESIERGGSYSFDLSGPFLEQCRWDPEMLESFRELAENRRVEFTGSCNYHSLSALYPDLSWFREGVTIYREMLKELFGIIPETFVNTELLYTQ